LNIDTTELDESRPFQRSIETKKRKKTVIASGSIKLWDASNLMSALRTSNEHTDAVISVVFRQMGGTLPAARSTLDQDKEKGQIRTKDNKNSRV